MTSTGLAHDTLDPHVTALHNIRIAAGPELDQAFVQAGVQIGLALMDAEDAVGDMWPDLRASTATTFRLLGRNLSAVLLAAALGVPEDDPVDVVAYYRRVLVLTLEGVGRVPTPDQVSRIEGDFEALRQAVEQADMPAATAALIAVVGPEHRANLRAGVFATMHEVAASRGTTPAVGWGPWQ